MANYPITNASLNLTQSCNLQCTYCFTHGKTDKVMTLETAQHIVDFLYKNASEADIKDLNGNRRNVEISFWGGEPLTEWELLKKIVLYAEKVRPKDVSLHFGGTTNGVLLTPEKFDFLDKHKIYFMISLDGTAETHNRFRRTKNDKGSHELIMKNIPAIIEKWPFYRVRTSPYPERINHFYEDVKYLIDNKLYYIMFSPVYENKWTEKHWEMWENQCMKIVDLMAEYKKKGITIHIEHFKSYVRADSSKWPCGAGRFYVGFDTDGSIWPCHRFNKFGDLRPWQEKEMCIGHVDYGITRPKIREMFMDSWNPQGCNGCDFFNNTPCHGGCYALNYDLEGSINKAHSGICRYVKMQKKVSMYYNEKIKDTTPKMGGSCVCNNMCYMEGTDEQIIDKNVPGMTCICYNTNYNGSMGNDVARPLI